MKRLLPLALITLLAGTAAAQSPTQPPPLLLLPGSTRGMALGNGLLVHGPTSWAAAIAKSGWR